MSDNYTYEVYSGIKCACGKDADSKIVYKLKGSAEEPEIVYFCYKCYPSRWPRREISP